jgi:hypothetical protein
MALSRPNFRTESDAENTVNGISRVQISKQFRGRHGETKETLKLA